MMSKKTYESVANAVHTAYQTTGGQPSDSLLTSLCSVFRADNPRFNADRFREACLTGNHIRRSIKG